MLLPGLLEFINKELYLIVIPSAGTFSPNFAMDRGFRIFRRAEVLSIILLHLFRKILFNLIWLADITSKKYVVLF